MQNQPKPRPKELTLTSFSSADAVYPTNALPRRAAPGLSLLAAIALCGSAVAYFLSGSGYMAERTCGGGRLLAVKAEMSNFALPTATGRSGGSRRRPRPLHLRQNQLIPTIKYNLHIFCKHFASLWSATIVKVGLFFKAIGRIRVETKKHANLLMVSVPMAE